MVKKEDEKVVLEEDRNPVEVKKEDKVDKTDVQDRTAFKDTDHVQYHLDVDPNDPRKREPAAKLPSLNDPGQS